MINIGIVGFGFMGNMHFNNCHTHKGINVKAICDIDSSRLNSTRKITGNIDGPESGPDLSGIELYADFDEMLNKSSLDALIISLPTYLHKEFTVKALKHGLHVFCEKPMALTVPHCKEMISTANKAERILQIGHCIRFWPEYDLTKEIINSGKYGKVKVAAFRRLSFTPTWSWHNWLLDGSLSGGASLDMHIHDSDFIQYLFGMPEHVKSTGVKGVSVDYDHIATNYYYADNFMVTAEGGWIMAPGFGFEMSFYIILEKATLIFDITKTPVFKICTAMGETIIPDLKKGDGYSLELDHFIKSIKGMETPGIITPEMSLESVKLALAEKKSAKNGKMKSLKLNKK